MNHAARASSLTILLIVLGFYHASAATPKEASVQDMIDENFVFAKAQYQQLLEASRSQGGFPRSMDSGKRWNVGPEDWTSGFFPGALWLLYDYSREEQWRLEAEKCTQRLEPIRHFNGHHDIGFMLGCSFGQGLRLTGNAQYRAVLVDGARALATRFRPEAGVIRSWDFGPWRCPVIIDNMMNLELLFWAAQATGDMRLRDIALSHANKTLENHFREDSSSFHLVDYDPQTGKVLKKQTVQGYADNSAWARGQAWGLYGFTVLYRETHNPRYLERARKIAEFLIHNPKLPDDKIPSWDLDTPTGTKALRDTSAAAIMASALVELSDFVEPAKAQEYLNIATLQFRALSSPAYRAKLGENGGFILMHGVGHIPEKHEIDVPLIYGDYYFLELMLRLRSRIPHNN